MGSNSRVFRMGMVGGGRGAFIGAVHRTAACMDGRARFTAGCLSSVPEKALGSGRDLGLPDDRNHPTWQAMLASELKLPPGERIDFVSIVTPNHVHHEVALAFTMAGFHVVCDKPLVHTTRQALELVEAVRSKGTVFAVTYNYSGYPLVKEARTLVLSGELGDIRKVVVEYNQGWLAGRLEATGQKQADWRTDPVRSGVGGAIGDIGSHAEQLLAYITGYEISEICADLTTFVPGRKLDDDANLLLRLSKPNAPPAKGVLVASQIEIGHENDLRIRVFGSKASLEWRQEDPNMLVLKPDGQPERVYRRGNGYLGTAAARNTRLPPGHPEAFLEAFANVYIGAMNAIAQGDGGLPAAAKHDFPGIIDGARGVNFIQTTVASSQSSAKWTPTEFSVRP